MIEFCPLCLEQAPFFYQKTDPHLALRQYFRCPNCQLIFLSPDQRLDRDQEKSIYAHHENNPNDAGYLKFLSQLTTPLEKFLNENDQGLDYGCGPGPALDRLLKQKISCYDPFFNNQISVLQNQYDFITCTEVIEHVFAPRETFMRFNTLLKNPGTLGLMTSFFLGDTANDFDKWWYHKDPTHVCFFSTKTFHWIAKWLHWSPHFIKNSVAIFTRKS